MKAKKLLYTTGSTPETIVLAWPERAAYVAGLHRAIEESKTWGEFKMSVPADEFARIVEERLDFCDDPPPRDSDSFSDEQVPGYYDGDYPPWLQQEMESVVPSAILLRFGKTEQSVFNGPFTIISADELEDLISELNKLGYEVEDGSYLGTWH